MRRSSRLRFSLHNPTRKSRNRRFLTPRSSLGIPLRSRRSRMPPSPLPSAASAAPVQAVAQPTTPAAPAQPSVQAGSGNVSGSGPNRAAPHRRARGNGSRRSETGPAQTLLSHAFAGPAPAAAAERFPALAGSAGGTERRPDELPRRIQYSGRTGPGDARPGITLFEIRPAPGVRVGRFIQPDPTTLPQPPRRGHPYPGPCAGMRHRGRGNPQPEPLHRQLPRADPVGSLPECARPC